MKYCEVEGNKLIKINYIPDDIKIKDLIPENIEEICTGAFQNMSSLTDLYIPKNVKKIYSYAFAECKNLRTVIFDCLNCQVDYSAFQECCKLFLLEIKHNTYFDSGVFYGCRNLTYINIHTGKNITPYRLFRLPHLGGCLLGKFIRKNNKVKIYKGCFCRQKEILTNNILYDGLCVGYVEDENLLWDDINDEIAEKGGLYLESHKSAVDFFGHSFNDDDNCLLSDLLLVIGACFVGREVSKKFLIVNENEIYKNINNNSIQTIKQWKDIINKYFDPYILQRIEEVQQHQYEDWNLLKPEHAYQHTIRQVQQQGKGTHVPLDWTEMA